MSLWRIYAWNKGTRKWGLVGKTHEEEAAELAVRTIASKGHTAKATTEGIELRATPLYFSRKSYLVDVRGES